MTQSMHAILQTLAYSAIFHFPLTKDELWQFLISDRPITKEAFKTSLTNLPKHVIYEAGFYTLAENKDAIKSRQKSTEELSKKMRIAKRAAYYLSYIPSIQLIGISGGVATGNVDASDDIDLFIVTKKQTLFMTRVWIQAILEMLNLRRKRLQSEAPDKICVNLLIDERNLAWPVALHDIYIAHEIMHLIPLFDRKGTYKSFLEQNKWVSTMLPNSFEKIPAVEGAGWMRNYVSLRLISSICNFRPFEKLAAVLQKYHMRQHQTTETVTETFLAFHPIDYRLKTLASLSAKSQQLGLLTNK